MNEFFRPSHVFAVFLGVFACAPNPARAQWRLATEGNVGVHSPYADPQFQSYGNAVVSGDFDGNGIDDLVSVESNNSRMHVMRGAAWTVGQTGFFFKFFSTQVSTPFFNGVIASGDFDGDGRDEIALGYEASPFNGMSQVGKVIIMDRDSAGDWSEQTSIRMGSAGYAGTPAETDSLGGALASGDFDNDGYDDLAIGATTKDIFGANSAGAVLVVYGSAAGIGPARSKLFSRLTDGQGVLPEDSDNFGHTLAVADFTGDGPEDLVISIPGARCPNDERGGGVVILRGSTAGIASAQSRSYFAGVDGVPGTCTANRKFGQGLATGRFNNDTKPDLVIGATGDATEQGSVTVLHSTVTGPGPSGARFFRGSDLPLPLTGSSARIGDVLATGPLLGQNQLDSLVMGVPYDKVDGQTDAGSVWIVHPGSSGLGLTIAQTERWIQKQNLVLNQPGNFGPRFGTSVAVGDFNGDNVSDLAVGAPYYDDPETHAGAVNVIYQSGYIFRDGFGD